MAEPKVPTTLSGLYQKCPDCQCDRICARDGKPIVDLSAFRRSEVADPEEGT